MMKLQRFFTAALSGFLLLNSFSVFDSGAAYVPDGAVASVTVNNVTSYYYDKPSSGGAEAMWNTAMNGTSALITLYADWNSSSGTRLGSGIGFIYDGTINVPSEHEITIDLNGCSINRNLEFSIEHGEVIHVSSGGTLNLTDTSQNVSSGNITGGNSSTGAGGIYIEAGGTVNLWGGNITGNHSDVSGGGVLLAGEGSVFSMSGGKIFSNSAQQCGGGVAVSDGTFKLANGQISDNTGQDGGGIYAQAGEVIISGGELSSNVAVHGGGILLNNTAALTLKGKSSVQNNIASGDNRVGGGILAMGSTPIQLGGQPSILNNSADGVQSNLVFWQESANSGMLPCYVQNVGTDIEAKIGVSLSGNLKQVVFAPEWSGSDCFICDAMDYTLENKDGNLILKRTASYYSSVLGDKKMLLLIVTCVLVALAVIAILVLLFKKKDKKQKSKNEKKKNHSKSSDHNDDDEYEDDDEYDDDEYEDNDDDDEYEDDNE